MIVTMTASWEKVFSSNPSIGYWAQHNRFKEAAAQGLTTFKSAKSPAEIDAVVRNTAIQGVLSILFAVLVLIVIAAAAVACYKAIVARQRGEEIATSEEPFSPSAFFAPSGLGATSIEKSVAQVWATEAPPTERTAHAHH